MKYPDTPKMSVEEEIHGNKITDPYRWLEDTKSSKVEKWVDAQNELAEKVIKEKTPFKYFRNKIAETFDVTDHGTPVKAGRYYFWMDRKPGQDQFVLYVSETPEGEGRELVNPNGMTDGNAITIDYWAPSRDGKYLAYGLSEGGDEMATLRVMDVGTTKNLSDEIPRARYSSICWRYDGSGFYYTRNPKPEDVPENEEHLHSKLYFHEIGDNPANDKLIFGKGRPKDDYYGSIALTEDGRYLFFAIAQEWTENDVFVYDTEVGETKTLIQDMESIFVPEIAGDKLIALTNYKANNYRIISTDAYNPAQNPDSWQELVPESDSLLEFFGVSKELILAVYLQDCANAGMAFDHSGKKIMDLPLPELCSLAGMSTHSDESEFFLGTVTYVNPKVIMRYDPEASSFKEHTRTGSKYDSGNYEVKREWTKSKDGTKMPLFVIYKKGMKPDGKNPLILTGYGGFNSPIGPTYLKTTMPWLHAGGVYAVAGLRGGGEYGKQWHRNGILDKKQNTFDDFIAIAEYLVNEGYTDPRHLAIQGGSNGGLLVGAAMTQRPDLFKAVLYDVPLLDMVRFPRFLIATRWVHEYGDPDKPDDLERILKWSPYHNVHEDVEYPTVLFSTGVNDTRVHPSHAWKMAALMQSLGNDNPVLVKTEIEAGHTTGAKPVKKIVESYASKAAFAAWQTGLNPN